MIGLVVVLGQLVGAPLTGGYMNPARSFGPALAAGVWSHHWVYWFGPLVGAAVAIFVHDVCFRVVANGARSICEGTHTATPARSF